MYKEIRSYLLQKSPLKGLLVRRGMKSCPSRSSLSRLSQPLTALPLEHKICEWQSLVVTDQLTPAPAQLQFHTPQAQTMPPAGTSPLQGQLQDFFFHRRISFHRITQLSSCIAFFAYSKNGSLSDEVFPPLFFSFIALFRERILSSSFNYSCLKRDARGH